MKFRTRLLITSVTIVLLPLLLTCAALLVVGSHIEDVETPSDFFDRDNVSYIYTVETYSRISEEVLEKVRRQIEEDPSRLEDKDYLDEIASDLKDKSSYIIIRKNDMLSYTSNNGGAKKIFPALPEYGNEMPFRMAPRGVFSLLQVSVPCYPERCSFEWHLLLFWYWFLPVSC